MTNASLKDHVKELQKMLDDVKNQLQDKDKVCKQEKENMSHEITALKSKLSSSNAELKNSVSKNKELTVMLESSRGRLYLVMRIKKMISSRFDWNM